MDCVQLSGNLSANSNWIILNTEYKKNFVHRQLENRSRLNLQRNGFQTICSVPFGILNPDVSESALSLKGK